MANLPVQRIYEFGDFRLDAGHLMLSREDSELAIAPKAIETLLVLVERRGNIVSKEELLDTVWPDTAVEESNLFLYLSVLRKTLGSQPNGEPWIETLRRRGYRFNGDVRLLPATVPSHVTVTERSNGSISKPAPDEPHISEPRAHDKGSPRASHWTSRPVLLTVAAMLAVAAVVAFAYPFLTTQRRISSIAVMPFANEGSELEYLSDGMTDNLIGSLVKIPGLDVKASSTMFRYKGNTDAAAVGKELDVAAVLSSRFVQRGENLTLYLELVDSRTENSLWQESYTRKMSQLGMLERDVIRDVVRALSVDLPDSTRQRIAKNYTDSSEAASLFMRGRFLIRKLDESKIREGLSYLRQATEHDPAYAPAFAMITAGLRSLTLCCDVDPKELHEAKRAAERALELDEDLAEAHSGLASMLYHVDWNFLEAEKHYRRALELDPNSAMSHFLYADFLGRMERREESVRHRLRARELEPYSPYFNAFTLNLENPNTALDKARFTIGLDPTFYFSHFMAAGVYRSRKMYPEAIAAYRRAKELAPEQTWTDVNLAGMFTDLGETGQTRAILDEFLTRSRTHYVPPFHIAAIYSQLGETEQALLWLERAYEVRDPKLTFLREPRWKKFETDPRFQDLKRRVGL